MQRTRTSLQKTENSDVFFYTPDASELLSFDSGCVQIQMTLYDNIVNGIYSKCDSNKLLADYLLFSVNHEQGFINYPGMYTAFSNDGIVFSIWTGYGRFYVIDTVSDLTKDIPFIIEFCWDRTGTLLGSGATMAIFVNGSCTASGDFMIKSESMSGLNFFAIDSKTIDFNVVCLIHDFVCYSELPPFSLDKVGSLTNVLYSEDEFVMGGKNGSLVWVENMCRYGAKIQSICASEYLPQTISVCDTTGNIYFAVSYDDGFKSGRVDKYEPLFSDITKTISDLEYPTCVSVIQREAIDFPRVVYYDSTECLGVWIGSKGKFIRTDANLVSEIEIDSFTEIHSIACMNDSSCWISDKLGGAVFHVSYEGVIVETFALTAPTFICSTVKNEVFVYESFSKKIFRILNGSISNNGIYVGDIIGMDCHKNKGYLLVCKSDGYVYSYNRDLTFRQSKNICESPSAILVRRGYNQDDFYLVDATTGKVYRRKVSNLDSDIAVYEFDKDILFNGSFSATARSNGKANFYGSYEMPFSVGRSVVKNVSVYPYTVNKRSVDLSAGGPVGAYLNLKNITSENDPTDIQGGVVEVSEITIGS